MIFNRMVAAALGMAGLMMAAPATAQQAEPDFTEMMCIYEELMVLDDEEYFGIVEAHFADVTEGELFETAFGAIAPAIDTCTGKYKWDATRQEIALMVGILGTVGDAVEGELLDSGVTEAQLDKFVEILDVLSMDDMMVMASGNWRADAPLKTRVAGHLKSLGYPNDEQLLAHGMFLVEAYVAGVVQMDAWLEETGQ